MSAEDTEFPCGPSLEYEPEYRVLLARLAPREEVQYGDFVGFSAGPDWAAIEREAQRLLVRSKDITLLVCLCRAATRLHGAQGLAQSLADLLEVLRAWPEAVHPLLHHEGEFDPGVRANALAALADPQGLLGDIGEIGLRLGPAMPACLRDVELAFSLPRPPEGVAPEAIARQIAAQRAGDPSDEAPLSCLARSAALVAAIDLWARAQLGEDQAPCLQALIGRLAPFAESVAHEPSAPCPPPVAAPSAVSKACDGAGLAITAPRSRAEMRAVLADARGWFETHEPSSPVALLLLQAERLVGLRFCEVADAIPLDLLRRWQACAGPGEGVAA